METAEFRSPVKKLLSFFRRSRDQWKQKCQQAKLRVKRLQTKVSDLQASRGEWKHKARQAQAELDRLQREGAEQKTSGG